MCVTRSVVHGSLSATTCLQGSGDRAEFGGRFYTDKAPGVSFLADSRRAGACGSGRPPWHHEGDLRLWAVRLATGGIALLACALLLGRVAEGIAPGWGGATLVTFSVGTLAASLAVDNFDEVPAAALGFGAFLLAWRRRPGWAGIVAGLALFVEYQAALVAVLVGVYAALAGGESTRPLRRRPGSRRRAARALRLARVRLSLSPLLPVRVQAVRRAAGRRVLRDPCALVARRPARPRRQPGPVRRRARAPARRGRARPAVAPRWAGRVAALRSGVAGVPPARARLLRPLRR